MMSKKAIQPKPSSSSKPKPPVKKPKGGKC